MMVLFAVPFYTVKAQSWEYSFQQLYNIDNIEPAEWEELYQLLCDLEEHPINLNAATHEQLEQLPFLTDHEIEDLCEYLYHYAPMKSLGELAMIESLDITKRSLLQHFIFLGEVENKKKNKSSIRHELLATAKIPFYRRKGDIDGYLGERYRHQLRYDMRLNNHLRLGLVAAQDAGEPFFCKENKQGYDYYSLYLMMKDIKFIKTFVAGNYRLSTGMGLVINSDFIMGKTSILSSLGRQQQILRPHSSTTVDHYLSGVAATCQLSRTFQVTPFVSYRPIDGTLSKDSLNISSIVGGGYHRTETEMKKKNNTWQTTAGMNLSYQDKGFHAALTFIYNNLNRALQPNTQILYRYYNPKGRDFVNIGIDYNYYNERLSFNGETATDRHGAIATLNTVSWKVSPELNILALHRFYSIKYSSLFARSFSEGGKVQNESGVYVGTIWQPRRKIHISAYADFSYYAWPRFQAPPSSHHQDYQLNVNYLPGRWTLSTRYRFRMKEQEKDGHSSCYSSHHWRLIMGYNHHRFSSRTQGELTYESYQPTSKGWAISEQLGYHVGKEVDLYASSTYFHTDDDISRVYLYERGMLYQLNAPMFYGHGLRYTLSLRATLLKSLVLHLRCGVTDYFDRSVIGSGYQQVGHSSMTDLDIQVKWGF